MLKKPLGRTGLMVSEFCLGTMTFGRQTGEEEAHAQLDLARDHGIDFIDTAEMYPTNPVATETVGRTEEIIGNWLARTERRGELVIATKITGKGSAFVRGGAPVTAATVVEAVEGSLRRLRTDVIDLYQIHWPNRGGYHFRRNWEFDPSRIDREAELAHMAEVLEALAGLVRAGKIRFFGLSNETAWGTSQWLRIARDAGLPEVQTIQNEYSLLCRHYDLDLAELGQAEQVTLLAYSPLAAGLLTGKYAGRVVPSGSRMEATPNLGGRITPQVWGAVAAYLGVAKAHGLDPARMALAFLRDRPFPIIPILGATRFDQLVHDLGAAELTLSPEVRAEIAAVRRDHPMPY